MQLSVVITTVGSKEAAEKLARRAVEARLAACVQIVAIESVYRWEGLQQEAEWRLEMKTQAALAEKLMAWLPEHHPYDEPELIAIPVLHASEAYAQWVAGETGWGADQR